MPLTTGTGGVAGAASASNPLPTFPGFPPIPTTTVTGPGGTVTTGEWEVSAQEGGHRGGVVHGWVGSVSTGG